VFQSKWMVQVNFLGCMVFSLKVCYYFWGFSVIRHNLPGLKRTDSCRFWRVEDHFSMKISRAGVRTWDYKIYLFSYIFMYSWNCTGFHVTAITALSDFSAFRFPRLQGTIILYSFAGIFLIIIFCDYYLLV